MKNIRNLCSTLLTVALITSCSSKRDDNGDLLFGLTGNPNNPVQVSKLLTKVTYTDDEGTQGIQTYDYINGQLSTVVSKDEDETQTIFLKYNNNVLSQVEAVITDSTNPYAVKYDFQYTNAQITKAIGVFSGGNRDGQTDETNYSYNSNGTLKSVQTTVSDGNVSNPKVLLIVQQEGIYQGVNLSEWNIKQTMYNNGTPGATISTKFGMSRFDDKKNPFSTLPFAYLMAGINLSLGAETFNGFSRNNPIKTSISVSPLPQQDLNYTYTYDTEGYPVKAITEQGTYTFEYIKR